MKQDLLQTMSQRKQAALRRADSAFTTGKVGFTLVELLVVIAITTILLGLLFGPIISSFNLTRRARAVAQAQDAARYGLERLTRELNQATYIYDDKGTGVMLPIYYTDVPTQSGTTIIGADPGDGARFTKWPHLQNGKIDLVEPATRQITADVIDPTTGQPVGGPELQPGVRGKRVVRYFLALRYPHDANGNLRLYSNLYEFTNGPRNFNPVILYRAEFDPRDANLFNVNGASYDSTTPNGGGFNDPYFFYGTGNAANGRTYGQNWQAIAQPVLVSQNMDLIRWNRVGAATNRVEKDATNPFTPTVAFAPSSIVADVATASTLTSGGVETPAAVPTVYQAKYGAWTYPYKITVLRGSTNYNPSALRTPEPFGQMTLTVDRDDNGNIGIRNTAGDFTSTGTLQTNPTGDMYSVYSPTTHKLFVKTTNLTFAIDTDRGRIETAFPPLYGTKSGGNPGVPWYQPADGSAAGNIQIVSGGGYTLPQLGDVIPIQFRLDSRDPQAGTTAGYPTNLGIFNADLFTNNYATLDNVTTGLVSPLAVFGIDSGAGKLRGVRILPGTERVIAPTMVDLNTPTLATLATWVRVVPFGATQHNSRYDSGSNQFINVPERRPVYTFDYDELPQAAAEDYAQVLHFTESPVFNPTTLAADTFGESGMAAATTAGKQFMTATYLWQNNFSRYTTVDNNWGNPLDALGNIIQFSSGAKPEADIFRVDYATRQQYSISLGARIYDPTDGQVQSLNVSDKVVINNVIR